MDCDLAFRLREQLSLDGAIMGIARTVIRFHTLR